MRPPLKIMLSERTVKKINSRIRNFKNEDTHEEAADLKPESQIKPKQNEINVAQKVKIIFLLFSRRVLKIQKS